MNDCCKTPCVSVSIASQSDLSNASSFYLKAAVIICGMEIATISDATDFLGGIGQLITVSCNLGVQPRVRSPKPETNPAKDANIYSEKQVQSLDQASKPIWTNSLNPIQLRRKL
eukprot:6456321-Amphidinium_carterae.1